MATKSYDHAVIYNGEFYPANTPIVVEDEEQKAAAPAEGEKENDGKGVTTAPDENTDGENKDAAPAEGEKEAEEKAVKANANKRTGRKPKAANTTD